MKQIHLSQGYFALVDDSDYPLLSEFKWCYRGERDGKLGYAVRHIKVNGKDRLCYLHRQIMQPPDGMDVIFSNHDRLDCRRENLKVVTKEEARRHHRVRRDSKSGIKGVRFNPDSESWSAFVYRHGHCYRVGNYFSKEQAVEAYEQALIRENPNLHSMAVTVVRPSDWKPTQRSDPDGVCLHQGQ